MPSANTFPFVGLAKDTTQRRRCLPDFLLVKSVPPGERCVVQDATARPEKGECLVFQYRNLAPLNAYFVEDILAGECSFE